MTRLYERIAADLRHQIRQGDLLVDQRLPTETRLAEQYGVGLPTLREALSLLQAEGLVEKLHGRGNFVRGFRPRIPYDSDRQAVRAMAEPAERETRVQARTTEADSESASAIGVDPGAPLLELRFCTWHGDEAESLVNLRVPLRHLPPGAPELRPVPTQWGDEIRDQLRAAGVELAQTEERITARPPISEEAERLRIPGGGSVLAIERLTTDPHGRTVEAATLVLSASRGEVIFRRPAADGSTRDLDHTS